MQVPTANEEPAARQIEDDAFRAAGGAFAAATHLEQLAIGAPAKETA